MFITVLFSANVYALVFIDRTAVRSLTIKPTSNQLVYKLKRPDSAEETSNFSEANKMKIHDKIVNGFLFFQGNSPLAKRECH